MKRYATGTTGLSGKHGWPTRWPTRWLYGILLLAGMTLSGGCATGGIEFETRTGTGTGSGTATVGPQISSEYGEPATVRAAAGLPKIEVVVPVFDPNLPEDSDTWKKQGIYPELRRAEANRFALKMKTALEDTGAFGRVRVAPNASATGDLYVNGAIIQSNGEDVKINIAVADISGRRWFTKNFKHRVKEAFHNNLRNQGKDAYDPVFEKAAAYIVSRLNKRKPAELERLRLLAEVRFGGSLSGDTFARYMKEREGRVELAAAPADDDPMLLRIKPLRVRDQLFIDRMQTHYADFDQKLDGSYLAWQEQSLAEVKAARTAKRKAIGQGILGGLLAVAGVAAATAGSEPGNYDSSAVIGGTTAAVAGAVLLGHSFQNRAEMKFHREALAELGQSIDIEIAPQVVEYENKTAQLTGDAAQQHRQWIAFLKEIYDLEATPEKQL